MSEVKIYSESLSKSLFYSFFSTFPVIENIAAEDVVAGICNKILPLLENNFKITVIINPLTFDAITKHDDVSKIFQAPWITVEQSEKLGPSDIEIIWPDGHLIRDVESATKDILMYVAGDFTK
ncbi:hypothetical protein AA23498_2615 [Acetobacter nitrogenifigens DSM 23921 = NBRC 105050]|uniref:Uncharacterized protein n=1 Tax=Acetobacter nitrogenifigens DSM 23921 = NBRC 105050 TaxID=1120919 RepID=A0A511X5Z4_9PROT|nr:hypothetical protein [Acetobacter nitrogenifigens]GBQ96346.1 hypothetical protein AA23498_2615 [Acetobacter nitrogenifigens DSM 23921 = NBRC 105050]GEN58368.1 hypothetical protein ANI02nite_02520 [Acetobacter nitrogenifigens DSM 23921 = NBRC 105050]